MGASCLSIHPGRRNGGGGEERASQVRLRSSLDFHLLVSTLLWIVFVLLLFRKVHYLAWSRFTAEIFVCQVMCVCVCLVIPSYSASENRWIPANRTAYLVILPCSVFHVAEVGLGVCAWSSRLFIHGIYYNENEWKCFFASSFVNTAGAATSPWHHSYKCSGSELISQLCAGLGRRLCQTFRSENSLRGGKCFRRYKSTW